MDGNITLGKALAIGMIIQIFQGKAAKEAAVEIASAMFDKPYCEVLEDLEKQKENEYVSI